MNEFLQKFPRNLIAKSTLIALALVISPHSTLATLGQTEASIQADQRLLSGLLEKTRTTSTFKISEMKTNRSSKILQYINLSGSVFGVTWTGEDPGEIDALLGTFAQPYHDFEMANPKQRLFIPYRKITLNGAIVEFWHTRKQVKGRAYIPMAIPLGMKVDQIQ